MSELSCSGCEHIRSELWVKDKIGYRCFNPEAGEWYGRTVGVNHLSPPVPAWCPKIKMEALKNG